MAAELLDRHKILSRMRAAGLKDKEIAEKLGSTPDKISKSWGERQLQEPEMAKAFQWLAEHSAPAEAGSPQPALPSAEQILAILQALREPLSAGLKAEVDLQGFAVMLHGMLKYAAEHPEDVDTLEKLVIAIRSFARGHNGPEQLPKI